MSTVTPPMDGDPFERVLNRVADVTGHPARVRGDQATAHCPAHEDHDPSLAITRGADGRVLLKCHAGCDTEVIVAALGMTLADLFASGRHRSPDRPRRERAGTDHTAGSSPVGPVTPLQSEGLTVAQLAQAKRLTIATLTARGVYDTRRRGLSAVAIPYHDAEGSVEGIRFRHALTGARFSWRSGDHVSLYGRERLAAIRAAGWVLLVEGESDAWTADEYAIPALGIPGKGSWREQWRELLDGLEVVLWQEPDAADLVARVALDIEQLRVIVAPPEVKDISAAHLAGQDVAALVAELRAAAVPAAELLARRHAETREAREHDLGRRAQTILADDDPLTIVRAAISALGWGGDPGPVLLTYLAATTRLLRHRLGAMPAHVLLVGTPSSGKTYIIALVLLLLPASAYHVIDAGSPRVLIYDDAPLDHRVIVFGEADSLPAGEDNPAASAIRALLQDGSLHYKVTVRDPTSGDFVVREVTKPGPTVLLTTAVRRLGPQLDSRLFIIEVPDDQQQLAQALAAQARLELEGPPDLPELDALVAYQELLGVRVPWDVVVPFANELAMAIGKNPVASRILRDYSRLLALVKAVAILRHRRRRVDAEGRLVAEVADYAAVYALVADAYVASTTGASQRIRATVEAVAALVKENSGEPASVTALAKTLGINKMAASRRARAATASGFLVNAEDRRGRPARLTVGDPLPEGGGLPSPEELERNGVTPPTDGQGLQDVSDNDYPESALDGTDEDGSAADAGATPDGGMP